MWFMLVILIGLNSNTGKRHIQSYAVRLTNLPMPCKKTILEQFLQAYLSTGSRESIEIQVVDVDIPVTVHLSEFRGNHRVKRKLFRRFAPDFEHCTHRSVRIYVGILTLRVVALSFVNNNAPDNAHELALAFTHFSPLLTVLNICLGYVTRGVLAHEAVFNLVLDCLNAHGLRTPRRYFVRHRVSYALPKIGSLNSAPLTGFRSLLHSVCDLALVKVLNTPITLFNFHRFCTIETPWFSTGRVWCYLIPCLVRQHRS